MALLDDTELAGRVSTLLDDLGGLSTAAVLGFTAERARVAASLAEVAKRWAFVDLRAAADAESQVTLARAKPVVVVATGAEKVPMALAGWLDAIVDKRGVTPQKVIVLCEGANDYEHLPAELKRLPYSEFVP